MAHSFDTHVDKLRKKSRNLLAQIEENSCRINQEIKKLCFETSSLNQASNVQQIQSPRISEFWQLRNDSRGVRGALCPDYYSLSPKYRSASEPVMTRQRRLLLSSKRNEDELQYRMPVKECYCNRLTRKTQFRSTRTKVKPAPCSHCRSLIDLRPMAWVESNDIQSTNIATPLSCETVRRVKKINYSPQSQFLQNKISSTHNLFNERPSETLSRSASRFSTKYPSDAGDRVEKPSILLHSTCRNIPLESLHEFNDDAVQTIEKRSRPKHFCSQINKESQSSHKKPSREILAKRTISSKKVSTTSKDAQSRKTSCGNFTSEGGSRSYQSGICRPMNEDILNSGSDFGEYDVCPKYSKQKRPFSGQASKISKIRNKREEFQDKDNEMIDLYKFREQNYFDTHGSSQTLLSSRSGSLERYLLNERLFPQPAGKINRGDLVVTIPPCATKQRKRIHYFPRFVVRQEKKNYGTGKQKNDRSCPLTGHEIDVGIFKNQHPSNSLALRFQKGVP